MIPNIMKLQIVETFGHYRTLELRVEMQFLETTFKIQLEMQLIVQKIYKMSISLAVRMF